jgi:hypothetical protein
MIKVPTAAIATVPSAKLVSAAVISITAYAGKEVTTATDALVATRANLDINFFTIKTPKMASLKTKIVRYWQNLAIIKCQI